MTEKEKVEQLESYKFLIMQIKGYVRELKMYRSMSIDISQKYSDMPHGTGGTSAKYEKPVDAIADMIREAEKDLQDAKRKRDRIRTGVNKITNIRYQTLLKLWYINCIPLDDIAEVMGQSDRRGLYSLRKSALKYFDI